MTTLLSLPAINPFLPLPTYENGNPSLRYSVLNLPPCKDATPAYSSHRHRHLFLTSNTHRVFLRLSPRPKFRFSTKGLRSGWNYSAVVKAQLNEVAADGSSEVAASSPSEVVKDAKLASDESISEFITRVSGLIKLVDSKDIVELQLKHHDCEILIRKKEALLPYPSSSPAFSQSQPQPAGVPPVSVPSPSPAASSPTPRPSSAPTPGPSSALHPPKAQPSKSSHPPLKSPMAGTFYRSPGPGEPPFVKVGDKVKKGQVLCVIEAMKLMNEIEADQSGTIVEILLDDGKPVSVDSPLFVIELWSR